jgi:predicted GNAT family N-acyltransferase|tara:strand:- start:11 stop:262 length:252 start_codon:yes stop_codon:yes gene_type:complete
MSNSLIKMDISKVLAEQSASSNITSNVNFSPEQIKKLNYEVMYKMLEGKVEKFVLENQGNPLVDNFKNDIVQTFSHLLTQLQK